MYRLSVIAIAVSSALLLGACAQQAPPHEDERPVRTLTVGTPTDSVAATYSGEIKARHEIALGFMVGGRIQQRLVEVGDNVEAGAVLLKLDPTDAGLNAQASKAQVDSVRSQVAQSRNDLQRYEALAQKGFVGRSDLEKARLSLDTAQQSLRAAEANYRVAANQAGYTTLKAMASGVITAIDAEAGHVVQAGQVVVHIAEHGEREIEVSVPESRVDELRHAASLSIQLWADASRRYTGRLRELAPNTDAVTRTYAARVSVLDPDAALGLGMTAKLVLGLDAGEGLRKLPLTALYDTGGTPQVWIVDRKTSRVEARALHVARMQKDAVLVREGLNEGDVVVTAGAHLLHAGQKVRLADSQTTTEG